MSYEALTRAFRARFLTYSRVAKPLNSLLSMAMREGKSLRAYSNRYWEIFNEIEGDSGGVVASTFKVGLHMNSDLRKSLTIHPAINMHQLKDRIEECKRVEDG